MSTLRKFSSAFISVWHKGSLEKIAEALKKLDIRIYSTGGTADFIEKYNIPVIRVESLTGYPSILGGRVKTLHPKIFGGILARSDVDSDNIELEKYGIPRVDLVITDLYPFEATVAEGRSETEVIEKIDIGGISLIRAAAKNFRDVLIIPSRDHYPALLEILEKKEGSTTLEERKEMAGEAFRISSRYDTAIYNWFTGTESDSFSVNFRNGRKLRYGENPHQSAVYYEDEGFPFKQLHGKEISYNNLLDIDAACQLIAEFDETTFAILKHNNACGLASADDLCSAYKAALAGDPVSAFGGVLVTNREIDNATAAEMDNLFFEVIIAPGYSDEALEILKGKKNRIILIAENVTLPDKVIRTVTGGVLVQDSDTRTESASGLKVVTQNPPGERETSDLLFANKIVKHTKSNAIVLAKNSQLIGSGAGQTSRVDALKHAIEKARTGGFDLNGAVMASDAFFPFADSVEIAGEAGITAVIQPGGSVRDKDSIDFCNQHNMKMVFTGVRHFRH
ncbi:MAG: bifunctional phosphoribosylaminoimidazolecarboxamide formyltransferase/IMP cyclohydrolase PurH [Marinilabiliales bacterium]|nr:MAG: bifunctional phosphoribosylaminoimidazolecarboxamide formyltransferase/IMP cyclohydrolase PurH [Marinilabiliales bacterium]